MRDASFDAVAARPISCLPALTIAAGPIVFSEPLPDDTLGMAVRILAFSLVICAAAAVKGVKMLKLVTKLCVVSLALIMAVCIGVAPANAAEQARSDRRAVHRFHPPLRWILRGRCRRRA